MIQAFIDRVSRRSPDFIIGGADRPYIRRWWVLPRNRVFNVYLHQILRDDDDRALHDHPWWNGSIVLSGGYFEVMPALGPEEVALTYTAWRSTGSVVLRRARAAHRLMLKDGRPCWSLFITGPKLRTWGFWCPHGWRRWTEFVAVGDKGQVGRGCE
jgi:hypothetical protein